MEESPERLFATDRFGRLVRIGERGELLREIRAHAELHGEVPYAVAAVHLMLLTPGGLLRLTRRGDKPENPFLWDKTVGGHVTAPPGAVALTREVFDDNLRRETAEEIGLESLIIAQDALHYREWLHSGTLDLTQTALVRLIDVDPWQASLRRDREGRVWLKRGHIAVYAGVCAAPFRFADGEVIDQREEDPALLRAALVEEPWRCTDDMRVMLERYFHLLKAGLPL
ncbi:MAG: NUDIX domain-containing protein [Magnetococcales bacterium]|nr:NUDIX domain-containing protein [Magnetococcales bacterium]